MTAEDVVREYYEALRRGEPLSPYFLEVEAATKFGISEALFGYDEVAEALREQSRTTVDWTVESRSLLVREHGDHATFADEGTLEWTDRETDERHSFETRWSGALERRSGTRRVEGGADGSTRDEERGGTERNGAERDGEKREDTELDSTDWAFLTMHVSAPHDL